MTNNKYLLELETKLTQAEETIATYKSDTKDHKKQIKDLAKENKALEKEITQAQNFQAQTIKKNNSLGKDLATYKQKVKQFQEQNNQLIAKYNSLENHSKNLNKSLTQVQQELIAYQNKNQILENKITELENQEPSAYVNGQEPTLANDYQQKINQLEEQLNQAKNQAQEGNSPPSIDIWENEKEQILTKAEQARNEQAQEIEKLEQENNQLDQDLNKAVDLLEAKDKTIENLNKTIKELKNQAINPVKTNPEPIKTFACSNCQQEKPQTELSRVFGDLKFCLDCSKKARQTAKQKQKPSPVDFICHLCEQSKTEIPSLIKLDKTLAEYQICSSCKPTAKEFNEADLITDDLWEKYPYSSASEILELEFGITRDNK